MLYEFEGYRVDAVQRILLRGDEIVHLTPKVFETLLALVERSNVIVSKDDLMRTVWPDTFVDEANLAQNISRLRAQISPEVILTVPKRGYRFKGDVRKIEEGRNVVRSLAVLPFMTVGAEPGDEHLGLCFADALITRLAGGRIAVRPASDIQRYAAAPPDALTAIRALRVDRVVEGTIQRSGADVRVTVRMFGRDGESVWGETFRGSATGAFELQETIGAEIATALAMRIRAQRTVAHEAYAAHLRGRYHLSRVAPSEISKAIEQFGRAAEIDPAFAAAHAGLAEACIVGSYMHLAPHDTLPRARQAAARAIELDPLLADAHRALGLVRALYDWQWDEAEASVRRAIALHPLDVDSHRLLGLLLTQVGRPDEGIDLCRRAVEIDPVSIPANAYLGLAYIHAGRAREAMEACRHALELDEWFPPACAFFGIACDMSGETGESIRALERLATRLRVPLLLGELAYVYGKAGRMEESRAIRDELLSHARGSHVGGDSIATAYLGTGEVDAAFEAMEAGFVQHTPFLPAFVRVHPWTAAHRDDPRCQSLIARIFG